MDFLKCNVFYFDCLKINALSKRTDKIRSNFIYYVEEI